MDPLKQSAGDAPEHEEITEPRGPRPALELLARLQSGTLMDKVTLELNRVVLGVMDCADARKTGTVTLTLKIGKIKKSHRAMAVQATVVGKAPEDPPDYDLLFHDDDGNLFSRNPDQFDIFEDGLKGT